MYHRFAGNDKVLTRKRLIALLEEQAAVIREDIVAMVHKAGQGHPGGSLSATDIVTALYFSVMNLDPNRPDDPFRDRFILSKGHCCPVWYAALARRGYFDVSHLDTLRQTHSILQGHPDMNKVPGIDMTSGSLGNGLSLGLGMALMNRYDEQRYKVYVMLGDGELQEGMVWEAAMSGAHYNLDNLVAIVDNNGLQVDGPVSKVMGIEPLADKWKAFGWHVKEIDGHNIQEILHGFEWAEKVGGPACIIAHTIKGKGVSFMENQVEWHGMAPNNQQYQVAIEEIRSGKEDQ